jgi:membrane-associated phospholipid phosphatase
VFHKRFHVVISALLVAVTVVALAGRPAIAQSPARQAANFASEDGNLLYLGLGSLLPLWTDRPYGQNHALRVIDAGGTADLFAEGLQMLTKEKRPDSDSHDSFPSGHATAAFAVAAMQSTMHPRQAWEWYTGASLISWSRLRLNRHHPQDVIAGALLGFGTAKWEAAEPHGLILQPWIHQDKPGISISVSF